MRWLWPLLLAGVLLLTQGARADPALSSPGSGQGLAVWTFANAGDYDAVNATLGASGGSLAWMSGTAVDTSEADFAAALRLDNIDLAGSPGDVRISNTSGYGLAVNVTWQPDPANLSDNTINNGNGGRVNYGGSPELTAGNWGGNAWDRAIVQFPTLPVPANASFLSARLQLYFYDPVVTTLMYFSAHRIVDSWDEMESTWDSRNASTPWDNPGGDFNATALDISAGVATTPGWFSWNITSLARGWWNGTIPNDGVMIRQVGDTVSSVGQKGFYSSDATNVTLRPRLLLSYALPGAKAHLESRIVDAGGKADWGRVWWNATLPAGTSVTVRTRSGDVVPADSSWSPWSPIASVPGTLIASPPARYLEYSLDLTTTTAVSPSVQDVSMGFGLHAARGQITTRDLNPGPVAAWGNLSWNATLLASTGVSVEYSQDGGGSWLPVLDGANLSSALLKPIRFRVLLATNDTTRAPTMHELSVDYRLGPAAGTGVLSEAFYPWLAALAAVAAIVTLLALRTRRGAPFRPSGLLLIHSDGRLIHSVGAEGMRDELAASAMLTVVVAFVRDSFAGPGGVGGDLKSLELDEREVSIAKGSFLYLALVSDGTRPPHLSTRMYGFLAAIEAAYAKRLEKWDGLREGLSDLDTDLTWFLQKGYRTAHPGEHVHYHP